MSTNKSKNLGLEEARGGLRGVTTYHRLSRNASPAAGDAVWPTSTAYVEPAATAAVCNVKSSSADDAAAGTGARTISITGVNGSFAVVTETVILNGTTDVATVNAYHNIHSAHVLTAGSGGTAVGTITIITTAAGTPTLDSIAIGANRSASSVYMVPLGHNAYINDITINGQAVAANSVCEVALMVKEFGGVFVVREQFFLSLDSQVATLSLKTPISVPAKALIKFQIVALTTFVDVKASMDLALVADATLS